VLGHGTQFLSELRAGDALIVTHPTSLVDETRVVKMVLSSCSIGISSAFSSDLVSTAAFRYISAPRNETVEDPEAAAKKRKSAEQDRAHGTYARSVASVIYIRSI
jgi:hypothetical protein